MPTFRVPLHLIVVVNLEINMEIASGGGKKIEQLVCDLKFEGYNIVTV
jgi:hypothetical protein